MERQEDRIVMSQRERDVARLLHVTVRQVRRIQRRLEKEGDAGAVHRLRGRASNRRLAEDVRQTALAKYRAHFADFGPTLACEKLAELEVQVSSETLRRWLLAEGLWQARGERDAPRARQA